MKKVLLIHGYNGKPNRAWRPWIMAELAKEDIYTCALPMPSPNRPISSDWVEEIKRVIERDKKDQFYIVAHSLGVPATLIFLQNTDCKNVKGCVLISGPYKSEKKGLESFYEQNWNFKNIKKACKNFILIHGENDKEVNISHGEFLSKELGSKFVRIKNGDHFGHGQIGTPKFPPVLKAVKELLK